MFEEIGRFLDGLCSRVHRSSADHSELTNITPLSTTENELQPSEDDRAGHPDQAFGGSTYAQHGEDLIILNIFSILGIARPSYIDIGAHHPRNISNTYLLYRRGSRGINVEANPNLIGAFLELRPEDTNINCGVGPTPGSFNFYYIDNWSGRNTFNKEEAESFVAAYPAFNIRKIEEIKCRTLDEIIREEGHGIWPDFMSIDVEGWDYSILESSTFASNDGPIVICVEITTANDDGKMRKIYELLQHRGYKFYVRTLGNALFLQDSAYKRMVLS